MDQPSDTNDPQQPQPHAKGNSSIFEQFINEDMSILNAENEEGDVGDTQEAHDYLAGGIPVEAPEIVPPGWGSPLITRTLRQIDTSEKLRPKSLEEIIGQDHVKETLTRFMDAAKGRGRPLAHTLLYGPPGLGKTTFASVISTYMGHRLKLLSGPNVDKRLILDMITEMVGESDDPTLPQQVIFIDEIHGVEKDAMTLLLPLMEDFEFEDLQLGAFTIVGATTEPSKLLGPLRDRFELKYQLEYYSGSELGKILRRSLSILTGTSRDEVTQYCDPDNPKLPGAQAIEMIAARSRGVPRVANHLIKRVVDYMETSDSGSPLPIGVEGPSLSPDTSPLFWFNPTIVRETMIALDIDSQGLERKDRAMLIAMFDRYNKRPVGVRAIAAVLGESAETVEYVMEPHLVRSGLINRDQRGRTLTADGMVVAALAMNDLTEY